MQDTFDIHKWKTYQMFLNESDDDFEFTDNLRSFLILQDLMFF